MALAKSRLTSQGQVSVPSTVRRRLGVGPGAVIEWVERDGAVFVQRAGRFSFENVHHALFPEGTPRRHGLDDLKAGLVRHVRTRHARR
jgi:bifunctional DNA-binding transcriptional regulator/antitoxin component of YhaV-PrlF toxin-antitoxin module